MAEDRSALARALAEMFAETDKNGEPKFGDAEIHAVRAMILLELVRKEQIEELSHAHKVELALLFDAMDIDENTDPKEVEPKVRSYYKRLNVKPSVFVRLNRLMEKYRRPKDRVEAIEETAKAYDKIMDNEAPRAPQHDEDAPEEGKAAQDLAASLGVKIRI